MIHDNNDHYDEHFVVGMTITMMIMIEMVVFSCWLTWPCVPCLKLAQTCLARPSTFLNDWHFMQIFACTRSKLMNKDHAISSMKNMMIMMMQHLISRCCLSSLNQQWWESTKLVIIYIYTRSLRALRAPTSSLRPFGPAFGPSGLLDFVLRALRALRPCDPRNDVSDR